MSNVKRYEMEKEYSLDIVVVPVEESDGTFVHYEDYAELKAQRDALGAENAVMLELLTDISEQYQEVQTESEENAAVIDLDYISEVNTYVSRDVDGENPFTATDTYLNSVRADVIKQLHSEQKEWALHTWQYDNFDALKRAAVRHGDSELSGVIFMLDRIEGFAAQLRAGKDGE